MKMELMISNVVNKVFLKIGDVCRSTTFLTTLNMHMSY